MGLSEDASRDITIAEDEIKKRIASLKKVLKALGGTKAKIAKIAWPRSDLRKLLVNLDAQKLPVSASIIEPLVLNLNGMLKAVEADFQKIFVAELLSEAQKSDIPFGHSAGIRFLGPFEFAIDFDRESCMLYYAKQPVSLPIPLDVKAILECARKLAAELLIASLDPAKFAVEFLEAHRVALIRDRRPIEGGETRSTLPELFREMQYIRQDRGRLLSAGTYREYTLSRFVVELKTLVQSDLNISAQKRFRLETAVIENTKNAKKSIFVPNDLRFGFGEGMYFQALVLVDEGR